MAQAQDSDKEAYSDDYREERQQIRGELSKIGNEAPSDRIAQEKVRKYFDNGPWEHIAGIGFSIYAHTEYPIAALQKSSFAQDDNGEKPFRGKPEWMIVSEYTLFHFDIGKSQYEAKVGFDPTCYND